MLNIIFKAIVNEEKKNSHNKKDKGCKNSITKLHFQLLIYAHFINIQKVTFKSQVYT